MSKRNPEIVSSPNSVLVVAALSMLIGGCRNRLLDRIDSTVDGLERNCASLLDSSGAKTLSIGDSFVKITGQDGSSCECSEDEKSKRCRYDKPSKGNSKVSSDVFFDVEVENDDSVIRAKQRSQYKVNSIEIQARDIEGVPTCVRRGENNVPIGVTRKACEETARSARGHLINTRSAMNSRARN
jgi:hypothetical protein